MIIVTSHWKEDLTWLKKSKFPVVLIDKEGSDPSCFEPQYIIPNKGGAESTYFKYIIENYENLPDHIAFIHGHETTYHHKHNRPLLEVLEGANLSFGYIPLSNWVRHYYFDNIIGDRLDCPTLWDNFNLPNEIKPEKGSLLIFQPNSEFIVSKERILRHPKQVYINMFDVLMTEEKLWCPHLKINVGKHYALLENIFHIIFFEENIYFYNKNWFNFDFHPVLCDPVYPETYRSKVSQIIFGK